MYLDVSHQTPAVLPQHPDSSCALSSGMTPALRCPTGPGGQQGAGGGKGAYYLQLDLLPLYFDDP